MITSLFYRGHFLTVVIALVFISYQAEGSDIPAIVEHDQEENCSIENSTSEFLQAVELFANNVLSNGRDQYGETHSPLFADGISVLTGAPVRWDFYEDENSWIISNFASQQNLMRVLVGLTELTGNECYEQAAAEAVSYMFETQTGSNGLLYWGGHQFVDLQTMQNQFQSRPHELKNHFPFYEFMWEVDGAATRHMLEAIWNAHIMNWNRLDLNRHGEYDLEMSDLWDHSFEDPDPFFEGEGLTFINAGSDMIQAAMALYHLNDNERAKIWATRLYQQYVKARHPDTGLGVYQYSQPKQLEIPPPKGPLEGKFTYSRYGDRAQNQFGSVYGSIALEGNVLWGGRISTIYGRSAIIFLHIAEKLKGTEAGDNFLIWTLDGMKALVDYGYDAERNFFLPMWTDGQDLTGESYPRTGYYGKKGTEFRPIKPDGTMMISFARAVRLSKGDETFWNVVRHMFLDQNLGDPGSDFSDSPSLNLQTAVSDPHQLIMVLEIYRTTGEDQYLQLADRIGSNILNERFHNGYFLPSDQHKYARFDTPEPLAILHLVAAKQDKSHLIPAYLTGSGNTDGEKFVEGVDGRPSDSLIYEEKTDSLRIEK